MGCRSTPHEEGTESYKQLHAEEFQNLVAGALPTKRELKEQVDFQYDPKIPPLQEHSPRRGN